MVCTLMMWSSNNTWISSTADRMLTSWKHRTLYYSISSIKSSILCNSCAPCCIIHHKMLTAWKENTSPIILYQLFFPQSSKFFPFSYLSSSLVNSIISLPLRLTDPNHLMQWKLDVLLHFWFFWALVHFFCPRFFTLPPETMASFRD